MLHVSRCISGFVRVCFFYLSSCYIFGVARNHGWTCHKHKIIKSPRSSSGKSSTSLCLPTIDACDRYTARANSVPSLPDGSTDGTDFKTQVGGLNLGKKKLTHRSCYNRAIVLLFRKVQVILFFIFVFFVAESGL